MDGFVGNPPFVGGRRIRETLGDRVCDWLERETDVSLNADLSAHFFRRAFHLLGSHGTIGFIATNTIAQGDTRSTGLKWMVEHGAQLYDAVRSMKWPVPGANVAVSVVHVAKGHVGKVALEPRLDGHRVEQLNSRLRGKPERKDPVALAANAAKSFQGSIVLGMGFVLTPQRREELIAKDPRNAERIFRYIGGEEINSDPDPRLERYVINFGQMELEEAEKWPDLIQVVRNLVKPERDRVRRDAHRKYWWRYADARPGLTAALRPLDRCLATARVSKHMMFSWQVAGTVFSEQTLVFPVEQDHWLTVLQSRVHEVWARLLSSSMRNDLRYAPSDCFETFPFPPEPAFSSLNMVGAQLEAERRKYMATNAVGLTTTYNRLKDASVTDDAILSLRALHQEVDRAVLNAYGWSDIPVPPYCGATPAQLEAFEDEVLDRLFDLNERRAREESLLAQPAALKKPRAKKRKP